MNRPNKILLLIGQVFGNLILISATLFLQFIGYSTAPRIFSNSKEELIELISIAVSGYNQTYYTEMSLIGVFLFIMNIFFLKSLKVKNPFIIGFLLLFIYLFISIISVLLLANRFLTNHYQI
tara:strand:- start:213 stop:578 length:366 start_codon:yes stop_codon:yes gene_type:complete